MSLKTILKSVGGFLKDLLPWAKTAISHGRDIATEIKTIVDNPAWDVVTSLTSTKLDDAGLSMLRQFLANLLVDLKLADQAVAIGANYRQASENIASMELPEAKAGTLNTISASMASKVAEIKGMVLPIESSLATAQSAYFHPELLA